MTRLSALAHRASQQHDVISTAQLHALGWSKDGIRHLVRDERAIRVHLGVYLIGRRTLTREGRWMAALATPHGQGISHLCRGSPGAPASRLSAPARDRESRGQRPRPTWVIVHRSKSLTEEDLDRRDAIPTTTVLRTLADLARTRLPDRSLEAAVRPGCTRPTCSGSRTSRLKAIVRLYDPLIGLMESDLEALFLALCTRHDLPLPDPQTRFGHRADFTWPEYGLVVECDSRGWHDNDVNFLTDRQRQRALKHAGYEVLPFAWAEIVYEPAKVAAELQRAFARRRPELRVR